MLVLFGRSWWYPAVVAVKGRRTVAEAVAQYGAAAEERLRPRFERAGVALPPDSLLLVGLKEEKRLEVWAPAAGTWRRVHAYPVLAASGGPGPKLREGDRQVPEGLYRVVGLNPNSSYHLSLKLDYPNAFDWRQARAEGRHEPGSDIFIHGKAVSIGCLAIGDAAIEELFVLVARTGKERVRVVLAPHDPARRPLSPSADMPAWTAALYERIGAALGNVRADGQNL